MGAAVLDGLHQLVDDMPGRGADGIAHAEIDDVAALGSGPGLHGVHFREDIGWETADSVEFGLTHALGVPVDADLQLAAETGAGPSPRRM